MINLPEKRNVISSYILHIVVIYSFMNSKVNNRTINSNLIYKLYLRSFLNNNKERYEIHRNKILMLQLLFSSLFGLRKLDSICIYFFRLGIGVYI